MRRKNGGCQSFGLSTIDLTEKLDIASQIIRALTKQVSQWKKEVGSTFRKGRDLAEFVDFAQRQQDWVFDEVGYFCQRDEGECIE